MSDTSAATGRIRERVHFALAAVLLVALVARPGGEPAAAPPAAQAGGEATRSPPVGGAGERARGEGFSIPASRRTTWSPGIPGGIPEVVEVHATVDASRYGDGITDATAAINRAIQSAGDLASASRRLAVVLPPGRYRLTGSVTLDRSHVVLRGSGQGRTRLQLEAPASAGLPVVRMGRFWPEYDPPVDVVGDVAQGARQITVADGHGLEPGDVLQLDELDDPAQVLMGDHTYGKRGPRPDDANGPSSPEGYRSVGQQVEISAKEGRVLHLAGPVHLAFQASRRPQVFKTATARPGEPGTRFAGLESLTVAGGWNNGIWLMNVAFGWVRDVEGDGDPAYGGGLTGAHVTLHHAYRCEVRGCHVHHARVIAPGGGAYGISISNQSSDNLVEDNVARQLNKPIILSSSGGGNVVAYNYADDAFIAHHPTWQESAIDGNHGAFSHHDLFEGNLAPNLGADSTHGNAGWLTFFRNHATGANGSVPRSSFVRAIGLDGFVRDCNVVGNVLLTPEVRAGGRAVYESTSPATLHVPAAYRLGAAALGGPAERFDDGTARRTVLRHGNFDHVTGRVQWDPSIAARDLPPSLYLTRRPAFFGEELWPFVDPLRDPMVGVLPAKRRFDAWQAARLRPAGR